MKTVLVLTFLVFQATSSLAGFCSPLEYAEIKDKPSKALVARYCGYDRFAKHYQESWNRYREIASDGIEKHLPPSMTEGNIRRMEQEAAEVEKCNECKSKILRVLEDRSDYTLECGQK